MGACELRHDVMSEMIKKMQVVFRVDASSVIGMGHVMRCHAIAEVMRELGCSTVFVAGSIQSASIIESVGEQVDIIPCANLRHFNFVDGQNLWAYCELLGVDFLILDSYAVSQSFFDGLTGEKNRKERPLIAYIDDLYTYSGGNVIEPNTLPVDAVVNYSFYADEVLYESKYCNSKTRLFLGPCYAPLRSEFRETRGDFSFNCNEFVRHVLVTTGSTNPNSNLERLAGIALHVFDDAKIHVVVGQQATFNIHNKRMIVHAGERMSQLMAQADVAISAAGSTLYELASMCVPALAVPIVENQERNARAFADLGLGIACGQTCSDDELLQAARALVDWPARKEIAKCCFETVNAAGASYLSWALLDMVMPDNEKCA